MRAASVAKLLDLIKLIFSVFNWCSTWCTLHDDLEFFRVEDYPWYGKINLVLEARHWAEFEVLESKFVGRGTA